MLRWLPREIAESLRGIAATPVVPLLAALLFLAWAVLQPWHGQSWGLSVSPGDHLR